MAIFENTASEIGDTILIQAIAPIFGIVELQSYIDVTINETSNRYFQKDFSYSIDGIFFSGWIPLTNANLLQIIVNPSNSFYINYRYLRSGTDTTGILEFDSITLQGQFDQPLCENYFILPRSIFRDLFCYNPEQSHICAILTNKLFQKGILADYVERNEGLNPPIDDEDFFSFWCTVCCFYALILVFAKKIENFYFYEDLLQQYLRERDIFFCNDIQLQDLNYIKANYFDEIRQRGTFQIFIPKSNTKAVDGEFLRLICYNVKEDEFIVELITNERLGWWLNKSSPSYKGSSLSTQLIKGKEKVSDFLDLNNYNIYNANGGVVTLISDSGKSVASINGVISGYVVGFSPMVNNLPTTNFDNAIIIDERIDYEITFKIKQTQLFQNITFGCYCFDKDNNLISTEEIITGTDSNLFFEKRVLNRTDKYYFVRGILYNKFQPNVSSSDARLNIGFGNNLRMKSNIVKIIPYVVLDRQAGANNCILLVSDLKIRPLSKGLVVNEIYSDFTTVPSNSNTPLFGSFSSCFLTSRNLLHLTYKNNNDSISEQSIEDITREKLIPYNSFLKTSIIEKV